MVWRIDDKQGDESAKIRWEIVPYTRGVVLDLGCGKSKTFPHFIGVDNGHHEGAFGIPVNPDIYVQSCEKLPMFADEGVDAVFSSHLLEHIQDYKKALREWWRLVKKGGYLVLYLPHKKFYPNIGEKGANPDHKHDFLPEDIIQAMEEMPGGWDLVENQARNNDNEYSFFQVYEKLHAKTHLFSFDTPKPEKTAAVIRYGAFGDLLQASSVIAGLKKQGYHVTLFSSPPGSDVITHDPNIDKIILQQKDQVPNGNLIDFWRYWEKKFDKFVNLSESVEGSLLAMDGRAPSEWPQRVRHKMLNKNYLEFQHDLAGVPHDPQVNFFETEEERKWVKAYKQKHCPGKVVLWALAGSSVHKVWAGMDTILARILVSFPDVKVILVGGPETAMLEAGWENEPRIIKTAGKWSIRQSLAFAKLGADLVIGPETGVLNSVACSETRKVVFLSHSTEENLTRDWKNTVAIHADSAVVDCYPCHILHYNWSKCRKDEATGTAACQVAIDPEDVWHAILPVLR